MKKLAHVVYVACFLFACNSISALSSSNPPKTRPSWSEGCCKPLQICAGLIKESLSESKDVLTARIDLLEALYFHLTLSSNADMAEHAEHVNTLVYDALDKNNHLEYLKNAALKIKSFRSEQVQEGELNAQQFLEKLNPLLEHLASFDDEKKIKRVRNLLKSLNPEIRPSVLLPLTCGSCALPGCCCPIWKWYAGVGFSYDLKGAPTFFGYRGEGKGIESISYGRCCTCGCASGCCAATTGKASTSGEESAFYPAAPIYLGAQILDNEANDTLWPDLVETGVVVTDIEAYLSTDLLKTKTHFWRIPLSLRSANHNTPPSRAILRLLALAFFSPELSEGKKTSSPESEPLMVREEKN